MRHDKPPGDGGYAVQQQAQGIVPVVQRTKFQGVPKVSRAAPPRGLRMGQAAQRITYFQ